MPLYDGPIDSRLTRAIGVAKGWQKKSSSTGDAIKASRQVHTLAKCLTDPVSLAVTRSVGHAVAAAHMADHCLGAALYALKAVGLAGKSPDTEKEWQLNELGKLPREIVDLVLATIRVKEEGLNIE